MCLKLWFPFLLCVAYAASLPHSGPRPLVIWHGLGDSHSSPGMLQFMDMIKDIHSGIYIHSVYIEENLDEDRKAGFYGNANEQVELVAEQLASIPELRGGFDAIGFSQGGQFLRAYVERYNSPPINNLITFGSQHMGISDIPACGKYDFICQLARRAAKQAVYSTWAQENLIQAQYYRDPNNYEAYLESNRFLTSINNEMTTSRNSTYRDNLASLQTLVLVLFSEDQTVIPKESSWFGSEEPVNEFYHLEDTQTPAVVTNQRINDIIPMRSQQLYREDWIGLRRLDERKAVIFEICQGEHMQLGDCWEGLVRRFTGGP